MGMSTTMYTLLGYRNMWIIYRPRFRLHDHVHILRGSSSGRQGSIIYVAETCELYKVVLSPARGESYGEWVLGEWLHHVDTT